MPKKYYVVKRGHHAGVYYSWSDCQKEVTGFPGAIYKGFAKKAEASPVGLRLDGVESIPVMDTPTAADDLWTIIHNINILGTNYEK